MTPHSKVDKGDINTTRKEFLVSYVSVKLLIETQFLMYVQKLFDYNHILYIFRFAEGDYGFKIYLEGHIIKMRL